MVKDKAMEDMNGQMVMFTRETGKIVGYMAKEVLNGLMEESMRDNF